MVDLNPLFAVFYIIRWPVITTALFILVISMLPQSHEIFVALQEAKHAEFWLSWLRVIIFASLFVAAIFLSSLALIQAKDQDEKDLEKIDWPLAETVTLLLCLSAFAAIILANVDLSSTSTALAKSYPIAMGDPERSKRAVSGLIYSLILATFVGAAAIICHFESFRARIVQLGIRVLSKLSPVPSGTVLQSVFVGILAIDVFIVAFPDSSSFILGPLGVIFLFFSVFCIATSCLALVYDRFKFPAISFLLSLGVVCAWLPTNDNHDLRMISTVASQKETAPAAFKKWLGNRRDLKAYGTQPYPVYMVSIEGGGLYAAAHGAWTLATIQSECPAFAHHTFALSTVSGGSLGGGLFAALVATKKSPKELDAESGVENAKPRCVDERKYGPKEDLRPAVRAFFEHDFLTPVIAFGLFPDFTQRFWPVAISSADRGKALEYAFEAAWRRTAKMKSKVEKEIFGRSSRDIWKEDGDSPALLINATLVQTGDRVVLAPFLLKSFGKSAFNDPYIDILNDRYLVPLSTAISASARFPLITPPGSHFHEGYRLAAQLVDGGYYENSGVYSLINLIQSLKGRFGSRKQEVIVARAGGGLSCNEGWELLRVVEGPGKSDDVGFCRKVSDVSCPESNRLTVLLESGSEIEVCIKIITIRSRSSGFSKAHNGDFFSVVPAMYNARIGRGAGSIHLSHILYCGGSQCGRGYVARDPHVYVKYLDIHKFDLPLGWFFSNKSMEKIFQWEGDANGCLSLIGDFKGGKWDRQIEEENRCLVSRVTRDLNGVGQ